VCPCLALRMLPVGLQVSVVGSYNSAVARRVPVIALPPDTSTLPERSSTAVGLARPTVLGFVVCQAGPASAAVAGGSGLVGRRAASALNRSTCGD